MYTAISINVVGSKLKAKRQYRMAFWVFTTNLHISFIKCTNLYFARGEFTSLFSFSGGLSVALLALSLSFDFWKFFYNFSVAKNTLFHISEGKENVQIRVCHVTIYFSILHVELPSFSTHTAFQSCLLALIRTTLTEIAVNKAIYLNYFDQAWAAG